MTITGARDLPKYMSYAKGTRILGQDTLEFCKQFVPYQDNGRIESKLVAQQTHIGQIELEE